jgi:DNA-binding transcriptional MerR regulator
MPRTLPDSSDAPSVALWSEGELEVLEREHPDGVSTQRVVDLFAGRGAPLSEATFRKYVQLGLLPRSVRVGRKGKHRGSQGLYPPTVVRQIDLVRRLMAQGYTIQEIQQEFLFLGSDIEALARQLERVLSAVGSAAERRDRSDEVIARAVTEARTLAGELIGRLRAIEGRLAMRARMARAAV